MQRRAAVRVGLALACAGVLGVSVLLSGAARADIRIGVPVSVTGPQASLGLPEKNAVTLLPREIGGERIETIVLDDASDTTRAVTNTRKLMSESNVDLIIGSSTTPNTLAMIDVAAEGRTPVISLASSVRLIEPMDARRRWIFKTPHSDSHMASLIVEHAAAHGVKTLAYIGFANALGEAFLTEVQRFAELRHIRVSATERYVPTDASVTAQVLHLLATRPDAVVIGASGTPAALPARALAERGYAGKIYFNHGVSNNAFVRLCGRDCEGAYVPTGPVMVAAQLPDANPAKKQALDFARRYEAAFGRHTVSLFAAYAGDIGLLLQRAVPVALKRARPGTPGFRAALRDALENVRGLPTATGVVNMSAQDHVGLDQHARVMAQIRHGEWRFADTAR
ncbi:ABC transporter substrate-binding protein [Ralstonia syzygii subsp. celebesensis]|uniref:Branched-chain amino acid ABC transporter substrate-binding protein n=2 Tax=Ralstonia syzygii subsp. celebesensis TaxID=1310168 RepID=A0A1U9VI46_9RALS|nr:ABC transporter substrate-binding protein [Ralstonia syzygii]AQW29983.1 branched-chain amino acid ABC transporter substrate-binding protein [blood disease bacterium A2-HR MARDI]QQV56182.1 ABC transporter substrate-binding protein [Ralstonia syzygii subsp. celebesensis]CCA80447.1 putative branched amino acid transport system permease, periplasmic binding component [blood disease bacterium R229]